jgi:DNA invertase Pin-like site-specific DNA recombinase/transcription elongation factor Elf1
MADLAPNSTPLEQLFEMLKSSTQAEEDLYKPENLRYVLYARKSTTDETRQVKSKEDQIADCLERVVGHDGVSLDKNDIIKEDGSAKEPDIRPLFRKMLDDVISGKYDGIISYHPDRLARNMKEAGEIIDLLDKGIIKDLRFATSQFENNPSGKMLLGISFVLAKQFSEHQSEVVTRGNKRKTLSGKFLRSFLHGYLKTEYGRLYPDGENYNIIKHAFDMRIEGQPQAEIMRYLNSRSDYRVFKYKQDGHFPYHWDKDSVSSLLSDPTYAGIIRYSGGVVKLGEIYDFIPAIEAADFLKINQAKDFMSSKFKSAITAPTDKVKANLLLGKVFCKSCGKSLSSGITVKKDVNYYRYRCETDGCKMKNKGPRAKVITDYAIDYLDKYRFTTKSNYKNYAEEVAESRTARLKQLYSIISSLNKQITDTRREYNRAKQIVVGGDKDLAEHYKDDLKDYKAELKKLNKAFKIAKAEQERLKTVIPTYEKYLELFDNVADLLRSTTSITVFNKILEKFISNLVVEGEFVPPKNKITRWKVVDIKLKEPYAEFLKSKNFERGRGYRTRTCDLTAPSRTR